MPTFRPNASLQAKCQQQHHAPSANDIRIISTSIQAMLASIGSMRIQEIGTNRPGLTIWHSFPSALAAEITCQLRPLCLLIGYTDSYLFSSASAFNSECRNHLFYYASTFALVMAFTSLSSAHYSTASFDIACSGTYTRAIEASLGAPLGGLHGRPHGEPHGGGFS